jgi:hypothetical protein
LLVSLSLSLVWSCPSLFSVLGAGLGSRPSLTHQCLQTWQRYRGCDFVSVVFAAFPEDGILWQVSGYIVYTPHDLPLQTSSSLIQKSPEFSSERAK